MFSISTLPIFSTFSLSTLKGYPSLHYFAYKMTGLDHEFWGFFHFYNYIYFLFKEVGPSNNPYMRFFWVNSICITISCHLLSSNFQYFFPFSLNLLSKNKNNQRFYTLPPSNVPTHRLLHPHAAVPLLHSLKPKSFIVHWGLSLHAHNGLFSFSPGPHPSDNKNAEASSVFKKPLLPFLALQLPPHLPAPL